MKILIDIGHPAHVHYFRNFYFKMLERGHEILITSRDKEVCFALLNAYKIPYKSRGKGKGSITGKMLYMLYADWFILRHALKFKPDLFLSFASPYAAQASFLYRKPHLALDDTEHAKSSRSFYLPFTKTVLTPECYLTDLGEKQLRKPFYAEFAYLHRDIFKPDKDFAYSLLGLQPDEKFVLLRFISWSAAHDRGHSGIPNSMKMDLIKSFTGKGFKVFISSESELNEEFAEYRLTISPENIHYILAAAQCFVGESGTMSNEACILGTPAFLINSLDAGVFRDEVSRGLLFHLKKPDGMIEFIHEKIENDGFWTNYSENVEKLHAEMIDLTDFLVNFTENKLK
ncbi:MAG: DUF354 domain-containing protein [Bacteroidia bacterium]